RQARGRGRGPGAAEERDRPRRRRPRAGGQGRARRARGGRQQWGGAGRAGGGVAQEHDRDGAEDGAGTAEQLGQPEHGPGCGEQRQGDRSGDGPVPALDRAEPEQDAREGGPEAITMERVAKRAGTSKPVLYRRWRSRAELLVAAALYRLPETDSVPDSGSLRDD